MANLTPRAVSTPMATSETLGTSVADPALGSRWIDSSQNEYIVVDCQSSFVAGEFVFIDHAHAATRLVNAGTNGRVGVICAAVSGSDNKAYAQIYGLYTNAVGTSNVQTSKYLGVPTNTSDIGAVTAVGTSDAGGIIIYGAYAVADPDSGATSTFSTSFVSAGSSATVHIGFQVWLNYPYVVGTTYVGGTS